MTFSASRGLALVAVVLFVLAAVGFTVAGVNIVDAGLAFLAASFVVQGG